MTEKLKKPPKYNFSSLSAFESGGKTPKTHTERVLDRQMQRRNLVKLDKP